LVALAVAVWAGRLHMPALFFAFIWLLLAFLAGLSGVEDTDDADDEMAA
jgi:hypothetical protein